MLSEKNKYLIELLLRGDSSYKIKPEIDENEELREFIKGLFALTDDFVDKERQPDKERLKAHLTEVRDYAAEYLGQSSKFVQDLDIEIRNQTVDPTLETSYYDDLLKLRAAIFWAE